MSNRKQRDSQEVCARRVRELAQSRTNRQCFECGQPGVTYTDITVGCFVCTSCSGLLRGLNPPHRVKSISMTTFTQQEVEFLQNHGNEVGKKMWLCAFDPKTDGCFDARDAQRLKEFLQDKYEKKKWHFSKNKNWKEEEGPFSPMGQGLSPSPPQLSTQPVSHPLPGSARPTRTLSQSQLSSWDRAPAISPADLHTDAFTARPPCSMSMRDPTVKDTALSGLERQRPGTVSPGMGSQSHTLSFPALPRPSGRTSSSSGGSAPFKAVPKSQSVDFGGLSRHTGANVTLGGPGSQDRYAALSQLDSVFSECGSPGTAPPSGVLQGGGGSSSSALFSNRSSSSSTPPGSAAVAATPPPLTPQLLCAPGFPNPFGNTASSQCSLSPSNPFSSPPTGDSSKIPTSSGTFPQSASIPGPNTQSALPLQVANNQEANGFASFPALKSTPSPGHPVSINPFTGTVYPSRVTSRNPFI
ncbi:arf-GAP domain and FG repeat-containing protein 2-like isoform X1 [Arapaima gigas]